MVLKISDKCVGNGVLCRGDGYIISVGCLCKRYVENWRASVDKWVNWVIW